MEKLVVKFRIGNEIKYYQINDVTAFSLNQTNEESDYETVKNVCQEYIITVNDFELFQNDLVLTNIIEEIDRKENIIVTSDRIVLFNKVDKQFCVCGDNYTLDMDCFDIVDEETSKKVLQYLDKVEESMKENDFYGENGEALMYHDDDNFIVFTRWSDERYYYTFEKNF